MESELNNCSVGLDYPWEDEQPHQCQKATDQCAVNVFPIKHTFGKVGLGKLIKGVTNYKQRNNTQCLFKRWIENGQSQIDMDNNSTQVSFCISQVKPRCKLVLPSSCRITLATPSSISKVFMSIEPLITFLMFGPT